MPYRAPKRGHAGRASDQRFRDGRVPEIVVRPLASEREQNLIDRNVQADRGR